MGLFGKKKVLDASGEAAAGRIADRVFAFQRKVADLLNAKARHWNRKTVKVALVCFGIGFGLYCLWLVSALFR